MTLLLSAASAQSAADILSASSAVDVILFAAFLAAFAFGWCFFFGRHYDDRRTIRCRCGRRVARDLVIVDPSDAERHAETLSELCPICRTNRHRANRGAAPPKAEGGRLKDESEVTSC